MKILRQYALRLERKSLLLRAMRKARQLKPVSQRTDQIGQSDVLLFCCLRNERRRLPHFLEHYRSKGISHFLIVDNGSADGSGEYLALQSDCSVWSTDGGYKASRFGMDWLTGLHRRFGSGHWCLTVDADEYLVYPHADTRPITALTDWLDASNLKSFGAILLDLYPQSYASLPDDPFADPLSYLTHFDAGNYVYNRNPKYQHLWIQGGPRQRVFFHDAPAMAPALNKIPLVKWQPGAVYVSSTHHLLPRGLNRVYDDWGGEKAFGCLLHTKFLTDLPDKVTEELTRRQHYAASREYRAYGEKGFDGIDFMTPHSTRYESLEQLESLGLMAKGGWA